MSTRDDILASIRENRPQATRPLPVEFLHDVLKVDAFPWAKFPGWRPLGCIRWPRWTIRSIRSKIAKLGALPRRSLSLTTIVA
jgi:hypothetical protein